MFANAGIQSLAIFLSAALASACFAAPDTRLEDSRQVSKALGQQLKQILQQTIKQEGPVAALQVCQVQAPGIAADLSTQNKLQVGRTALKVRNANNSPADWQADVLHDFEQRMAKGEPAKSLEFSTVAKTPNGTQFRYMKAIPTAPECLVCHGSNLAEPLQRAITDLYPNDQAVGFKAGELRGAFVVEWPVDVES